MVHELTGQAVHKLSDELRGQAVHKLRGQVVHMLSRHPAVNPISAGSNGTW